MNISVSAIVLHALFLIAVPVCHAVPVKPLQEQRTADIEKPSAEEKQRVTVNGFRITGNTLIKQDELLSLLSGYLAKPCTISDLRNATGIVTKAYHDRGFSLAKAYLPVQRIEEGIVAIAVLEGRVGRIVVEGNRNYSADFIREYILAGKPENELTVERIERALLLLNSQFTDLRVTANFSPGGESGTTDLTVSVEDGVPVHGSLSVNNYGSEFVSRYRFGAELEWINPLVQGSRLSLGAQAGDRIERMKVFNAGYSLPLNSRGSMASVRFSTGTFDVGKDFADLGIRNSETSLDFSLAHPVVRSRTAGLTAALGFRGSDARFYQLDEVSSKDNIRALYASLQGDMVHHGGRSLASVSLTRGLGGWLDGTESGDPLASRVGTDNDFWRLNGSVARLQPINDVFSALLRVGGQWADEPLLAGEEWLVGGVNSVHGYAPGEESGEKGYSFNLALRASPLKNRELLQLSAFFDHGYVWKGSGDPAGRSLTGAGVGVYSKFDVAVPAALRFDVGWPIDPSGNSLDESPVLYMETELRF